MLNDRPAGFSRKDAAIEIGLAPRDDVPRALARESKARKTAELILARRFEHGKDTVCENVNVSRRNENRGVGRDFGNRTT